MHSDGFTHDPAGPPGGGRVDSTSPLLALLGQSLQQHHARSACLCLGHSLRYAELDARSRHFAGWLQSRGLARGERVLLMLPNVPAFLVAALGVLRAGLVLVTVNPHSSARELEHVLKDAGARAIVVIDQAASTLQQVLETQPLQHVLLASLGDLLGPLRGPLVNQLARRVRKLVPSFQLPIAVPFMAALAEGRRLAPTLPPRPEPGPEDIALLQYTGGTTGPSRGVVLLHRHVAAHLQQCLAWLAPALARVPAGEQPLAVGALPLHHAYGFHLVGLLGLATGGCTLLLPQPADTDALLKLLQRHRVHLFAGVEPMFAALLRHPGVERADWSSLVLCLGGGMAVQPATAAAWRARTGCALCEGYGLSEAVASVCCNPPDTRAHSGHLGLPLPGTEVAVLDEAGQPLPPGSTGEIAVRGPQVMAGYWQRPDETARVMAPGGWLRSGDLGVMDERGQLRLVDRKKDLIFVSGFNVYPGEVEDVLAQMPGVQECAVIGVPDERVGELVKAVVVRQGPGGNRPSEAEVRAWCEANLTGYKRPRVVEFRSQLPKSAVGKVLRRALREPG